MNVKIRKLHADAVIPQYATDGAAGFDLVAIEDVIIAPGETKLVRTGLAFEIPHGYEMQIRPRSGISLKTKLRIANAPGTIDSDFRGEVGVIIDNIESGGEDVVSGYPFFTEKGGIRFSDGVYIIRKGDRIAQAVIAPVVRADFVEADELTETRRAASGFGSTGTTAKPSDISNLAVRKGVCPFPRDCDLRFTCEKNYCNHDTCSNGFTYRMS